MSSESHASGPVALFKRFRPQRTRLRVSACVAASRSLHDPTEDDAE
ncbi:hypothetical protein [Haloferax sp. YSMS24]